MERLFIFKGGFSTVEKTFTGRSVRLVSRRFYDLPVLKDDLMHGRRIDFDAVKEASEAFAACFGHKPDAAAVSFAASGATACLGMQGSRLRDTTQRAILRRIAGKKALTQRQQCFWDECKRWQEQAEWLAQRTLLLNSGTKAQFDRKVLEWVNTP